MDLYRRPAHLYQSRPKRRSRRDEARQAGLPRDPRHTAHHPGGNMRSGVPGMIDLPAHVLKPLQNRNFRDSIYVYEELWG